MVSNADEFLKVLNENGAAGVKNYTIRYESSNGQPVLPMSDKFGYGVSYMTYNNGNSWLIDVVLSN